MAQPPVIELKRGYRCFAHSKLSYVTEAEALEALAEIQAHAKTVKVPKRAYKPDDGRCIYWHLTSKPRRY